MGLIFGLISRLLKFAIYLVLFIAIITLIPNLPPYTKFTSIEIEPTVPVKLNNALNNAEKLYKGKLMEPEAFKLYNGEVYTTLGTGEVVKLSPGGHVTFVTKLGQPCEGPHQEPKCGRPLGFDIDEKSGKMYVADAYHGIWRVDLKTDKKQLLVSPRVEIDGRKPMLFNSVALDKDGDFYWTDSSSDFPLNKGVKTIFSDPSGRLLHYNAATNKSKVLLDDLWFANGLAISPDNQFVVVAETSRNRLTKYYVDGPRKGKSEAFLAGLPGLPDNLQALPDGSGLLVSLYAVFAEDEPMITKSLAKTPVVRKFLARMFALADMPFELLNMHFPNAVFESISNNIANFKSMARLLPHASGLMLVDWNGNIVESYHNTDGSLAHISDAIVYQDKLLIGTPHLQDYVGAVPAPPHLKKAYASVKSTPPPKTAETVTKPIPKTTTQKPKVEEKKEAPKVAKPAQEPPKPVTTPPPPKTTTPPPKTTTPPPKTTTPPPITTSPPPKTTTPPSKTTTPPPKTTTPPPKTTTPPPKTTTPPPKTTTPPPKTTTKPTESTSAKPATTTAIPQTEQPGIKASPHPKKEEVKIEKPAAAKPAHVKSSSEDKKPANDRPVPNEIPIREELPSDTIKPTKEKLKVIKKGGPADIPNPAL